MAKRGTGGRKKKQGKKKDAPAGNARNAGKQRRRSATVRGHRILLKFQDHIDLPYRDGVEKILEEQGIGLWTGVLAISPEATLVRLFRSLQPRRIRKLVRRAAELDPSYRPPDFLTYYALEFGEEASRDALLDELKSSSAVEWAESQLGPVRPPLGEMEPYRQYQGYLDAAPGGIDAEAVRPYPGGDGEGIGFTDIESGWLTNHEDLPSIPTTLSGVNLGFFDHGTAVLGIVTAQENNKGCIGIAPAIASLGLVSEWRAANDPLPNHPDAILDAISSMSFGDVLLLELQINYNGQSEMPAEASQATFDVIRLAVALGLVVVEAAGNGGHDLDAFTRNGKQVLDRSSLDFEDSGAIVVGAVGSAVLQPLGYCSGSRVDCFALGDHITTAWDNGSGAIDQYTSTFSGTSAGSAIVAGAAILLQSLAEKNLAHRFSPRQVRRILSDPLTGTLSQNGLADGVGVMPDLKKILDDVLQLSPELYVRDHVGDTGDPHTGPVSLSPDIVVVADPPPADPQAQFGEGSGTEDVLALGAGTITDADHWAFVRVRNRGGSDAAAAMARLYWSPVATLPTPDLWTPIGEAPLPAVPVGEILTVSAPIPWLMGAIPAPGHYCFVALVGDGADPLPEPATFTDWNQFVLFIRRNAKATWRNFNVVALPNPAPSNLDFLIPGPLETPRTMGLEIRGGLPPGSLLSLIGPPVLMDQLRDGGEFEPVPGGAHRIALNATGVNRFDDVMLWPHQRHPCRLVVDIPLDVRKPSQRLFVRHLDGDEELGRVTWDLRA